MFSAKEGRYDHMEYSYSGKSGLKLPKVSLGLWHNFGSQDVYQNMKEIAFKAFDLGITHYDLANNYGPVYGSAEENFGRMMQSDLYPYRDEMIISTKAGYDMWKGPYGNGGSRKYLHASLDQSLQRMHLDYVDIFYHHRPDPETPMEETAIALADLVRQGKALYVGISNYNSKQTLEMAILLKEQKVPLLINQVCYNMLNRRIEQDHLLDALEEAGAGCICFSPLAQGMLTDRYLKGIPEDSRAARNHFLKESSITPELLSVIGRLNALAISRGQTLAQMALAWIMRDARVTSVLVGASSPKQLSDSYHMMDKMDFSGKELELIETILKEK